MIRAIILDVDGTLIDSVDAHARAWQEVFARHGFDIPFDRIRSQIGKGGDQLMPVFLPAELVEQSGEAFERERSELFQADYLPHLKAFPGSRALVERILADGKRVVLASSARADELEKYRKLAQVDDLIESATSSGDAEKSKPHPDIFLAALERLGDVEPAEALVVGDTPYDAQAASKAGIATVGVLCGGFPEEDLRRAGCVAIYRDPEDLLDHYDESPLGRGRAD